MTSSNGNIFLAICAGKSPVTGEFPAQRPVTRSFDVLFDLRLNKRWGNNREAGDLRRHRAHYDFTVMKRRFIGIIAPTIGTHKENEINTVFARTIQIICDRCDIWHVPETEIVLKQSIILIPLDLRFTSELHSRLRTICRIVTSKQLILLAVLSAANYEPPASFVMGHI